MSEALLKDHLEGVMDRLDKAQRQAAEASAELDAAHDLLTVLGVPRETKVTEGNISPLTSFLGGYRRMSLAERLLTVRHRIGEVVQRAVQAQATKGDSLVFPVSFADPFDSGLKVDAKKPLKKRGRPRK